MEIEIASKSGFCFGVQRAVDIAFKLGCKYSKGVYTLGPIIHNPKVVEQLEKASVHMLNDIDNIKSGILIVRSHGLPPNIIDEAKKKGLKVVDATCPFVKKVQTYAISLKEKGYPVLLIGDKNHPEVIAIRGYVNDEIIICESVNDLNKLDIPPKLGVVAQTTQDYEKFKTIVTNLLDCVRELKVYNTICDSTVVRQQSALKLAKKVDLMFVIGGKNSANTNRLSNICSIVNPKTHLIESSEEIDEKWLDSISKIGITAGASTPKWIIDDVVERLKNISIN
ncbi:4-hydroxy-3-methylbut-2-enyl diphosphate reductase [bacterium]|nr:4-hydroxy-3-methylbut-2-enyl diphosphate reductase [bacterium]